MKRLIIILSVLLANVLAFANDSFDETCNFQFDNVKAYEGEILYLLPITGSSYEKVSDKYIGFMDYSFNDAKTSENNSYYNYKFNPTDYRDNKLLGTHKRHIEAHRFYVKKVVPHRNGKNLHTWVFHLIDLNTSEQLKYIYHEYGRFQQFDGFMDFPFIVEKHLEYCISLRGTNLIFATNKCGVMMGERYRYYYTTFINDMNTNEKVNYNDVYAKWTIKDVKIDWYNSCICFIVTDGKNTTKVPYGIQYYSSHPEYNLGTRVFTENQWNTLVQEYGLNHMKMIMNTEISNDMTDNEILMSMGKQGITKKNGGNSTRDLKNTIQTIFNASTELENHKNQVIKKCKDVLVSELSK